MSTEDRVVLDLSGVIELTTLSQSTIYALAKRGEFPKAGEDRPQPGRVAPRRRGRLA